MKKVCLLILICFTVSASFAAFPKPAADSARSSVLLQPSATIFPDLKTATVKDFELQTGRKLNLREKLGFWLVKNHLLKVEGPSKGSVGSAIGGFFLGFLLPVIGLVIAFIVPKNKTLRLWALIGTGAFVLVFLFLLALGSMFSWT